jgi:hypothetical protein
MVHLPPVEELGVTDSFYGRQLLLWVMLTTAVDFAGYHLRR